MIDHGQQTCGSHRHYRLTCSEFHQLYQRAQGRCEICGMRAEDSAIGRLHIDHDHALGVWAVRGMLCPSCNQSLRDVLGPLGFRDKPEVRAYLSNPFRSSSWIEMSRGRRQRSQRAECRQGHQLTAENVYALSNGKRLCRTCHLRRQHDYNLRKRTRKDG